MKRLAITSALMLCSLSLPAQNKLQPAAPIPPQIASAKKAFLSNFGDGDYATLARDYNAMYAALSNWGQYTLTDTPADADLILELRHTDALGSCTTSQDKHSCAITLHILDRATHTTLWSISEPEASGITEAAREKNAQETAKAIVADLAVLAQPNATAGPSKPAAKSSKEKH
jgi:hypothetical protein